MTDITATQSQNRFLPLRTSQIVSLVIIGAVLWFVAAMLLRVLGPMGVFEGNGTAVLYALVVPGTYPFIVMTQKIAGLARDQLALGISVLTAAAMVLDGIALAWYPYLYANDVDLVASSGAAILWGAAVGMILSFCMNRTDGSE